MSSRQDPVLADQRATAEIVIAQGYGSLVWELSFSSLLATNDPALTGFKGYREHWDSLFVCCAHLKAFHLFIVTPCVLWREEGYRTCSRKKLLILISLI